MREAKRDGFVIGVRHPDGRQFTGSIKTRKHGGVTTICLHPIAGLGRYQRNNDGATTSQRWPMPVS